MIEDLFLFSFIICERQELASKIIDFFIENSNHIRIINYANASIIEKKHIESDYKSVLSKFVDSFINEKYTKELNSFYLELFNDETLIYSLDTEDRTAAYNENIKDTYISFLLNLIEDSVEIDKKYGDYDKISNLMKKLEYILENHIINEKNKAEEGLIVESNGFEYSRLFDGTFDSLYIYYDENIMEKISNINIHDFKEIVYSNVLLRLSLLKQI